MTEKPKQHHKSKEEILAEREAKAKLDAETNRKRRKVAHTLFPLLLANAKSVEEAKMLCQIVAAGIRQDFNNQMRLIKLEDTKLVEKLNPGDARFAVFGEILGSFGEETIFDALDMIEGMCKHLDGCITEEMSQRPLAELKVTFLEDVPVA